MDEALQAISTVGFPIFIAVVFVFRQEKVIKELKKSVDLLTIVVASFGGIDLEKVKRDFGKNGQQ